MTSEMTGAPGSEKPSAAGQLKQLGTGLLLVLLTLFNAVEGLQQEGKAAAAVAALQKMVIIKAKVRRDGQLAEIPAGQLVPGDVVDADDGPACRVTGRSTLRNYGSARTP
jgi:P-type Ca2+ transporter type 2C